MAIMLPTNFKVNTGLPIDDRLVVEKYGDLSTIPLSRRYSGMVVYVKDHRLHYTIKDEDNSKWILFVSRNQITTFKSQTTDDVEYLITPSHEDMDSGGIILNIPDDSFISFSVNVSCLSMDAVVQSYWHKTCSLSNIGGIPCVYVYQTDRVNTSHLNTNDISIEIRDNTFTIVLVGMDEVLNWSGSIKIDEQEYN